MESLINNRYQINHLIGNGGMADVYLALDTILDRNIALKIIRIDLANDPIALLRFQREAKAISKMDHQNIVQVYDVGEYNNRPYIVMEYVNGKTLKQLLQKRISLPIQEALDIMKQLTSALVHAHENNIIHRDIKPHNVLIKDDGTAKITDFGIALSHDSMQITANDLVLGSAHYLAPELTKGEEATHAADIYSLGILFYELLSGNVPFNGDTPVKVAMSHINDTLPSLSKIDSTIPVQIEMIVEKACAKNKEERYSNAEQLQYDLENYLNIRVDKKEKKAITSNKFSSLDNKKFTIITSCIALFIIIIYSSIMIFTKNTSQPKDMAIIPNVLGKSQDEAVSILKNNGFDVLISEEKITSEVYAGGSVATISPNVNSLASKSSKVTIAISKARLYTVPNFTGLSVDKVYDSLIDNNINLKVIEKLVPSDRMDSTVLSQSIEAGREIEVTESTTLEIDVATSLKSKMVINVTNLPIVEAQKELIALGFKVNVIGSGKVTFQSLEPYSIVEYEEEIEITLKGDS